MTPVWIQCCKSLNYFVFSSWGVLCQPGILLYCIPLFQDLSLSLPSPHSLLSTFSNQWSLSHGFLSPSMQCHCTFHGLLCVHPTPFFPTPRLPASWDHAATHLSPGSQLKTHVLTLVNSIMKSPWNKWEVLPHVRVLAFSNPLQC